jgi:predicted nucleotidyltransferase
VFYLDFFRALEREKVRYLVVGGVAVNLHGAERMTSDVDLMLALDAGNLRRFFAAVEEFGFKPVIPATLRQLCDAEMLERWVREKHMLAFALRPAEDTAPTVDILVRPIVAFEDAYPRRFEVVADGVTLSVAAAEDLITLKSGTGRQIDEADIRALRRLAVIRSRKSDD